MTIDAYATQPNYQRHLSPIVDELRARGHEVRSWTAAKRRPWGDPIKGRRERAPVALCAAWTDARALAPQPTVYVEHGAGQTYQNQDRGYAGSEGLDHVVLFLGPGEHVSQRWRTSYPQAVAESVGCPALDRHLSAGAGQVDEERGGEAPGEQVGHLRPAQRHHDQHDEQDEDERADADGHHPIVAVTGHWRCLALNETMPALPYFWRGISELARLEGIRLLGHAHPRAHMGGAKRWANLGVPFEPDPDEILRRADLLIADNSSLLAEAAACGIPLLFLNSPTYRRDVSHGGRFWEWPRGQVSCDDPADIVLAVARALADPPDVRAARERMVRSIYAFTDGASTRRAVDAIEACV